MLQSRAPVSCSTPPRRVRAPRRTRNGPVQSISLRHTAPTTFAASPGTCCIRNPPAKEIPLRTRNRLWRRRPLLSIADPDMHTLIEGAMKEAKSKVTPPLEELDDRYQMADNQWNSYSASNKAQPQLIPKQRTNGVRSVKLRMEAEFEDEKRRNKGKKSIPQPISKSSRSGSTNDRIND